MADDEHKADEVMREILTQVGGQEALTAMLKAGGGYEGLMALHDLFLGTDEGEDAVKRLAEQPGGHDALQALLTTSASPRKKHAGGARAAPHDPAKRNTALINREREASRIARENDQYAARMNEKSQTRPFLTMNTQFDELRQQPHSCAVNRQRESSRIERENVKLAQRLAKPTRHELAPPRPPKGRSGSVPPGWSRGVGGRLLPPPKQRWGTQKAYDAGEMKF
jgi:hypothetical protein